MNARASSTRCASTPTSSIEGDSGNYASIADATMRGLEADQAAQRRRHAHRAAGVRAQRHRHHARRHRRRAAGAGTAGDARRIPGIARGALDAAVAGGAVGEFMRQRLADHDGAGFAQQRHAARVSRRTMAQEMRGAHGGGHVGGVDVVLDGHGNAVQRTAHSPRRALGVERARLRQRGGNIRVHEGVELWVEPFDGRAGVAHQILGAECPSAMPRASSAKPRPAKKPGSTARRGVLLARRPAQHGACDGGGDGRRHEHHRIAMPRGQAERRGMNAKPPQRWPARCR